MSFVIVLATGKGGAGKTSLVRCLAAHWYNLGMCPLIIDADPQGSIISSYDPTGPFGKIKVIADPEETVGETIESYKGKYDPIIVDTGGFSNRTAVIAMVHSDLVIIPSKTSADDFKRAIDTYEIIQELNYTAERKNRPLTYRMVLTMTQPGVVIAREFKARTKEMGYLMIENEMHNRVIYQECTIDGLPPNLLEQDNLAARDISSIAREITLVRQSIEKSLAKAS
jgi:chromosome partitioning protein